MLTLEVEFLTHAYRASLPDGSGPEWPPHPERIFSALVQAWGDGGRAPHEREALEWLESLAPPAIEASAANGRDEPIVYVPPNDSRGNEISALPDRRARQARTFRAMIPDEPIVRLHWDTDAPKGSQAALAALAQRVASIGHSSSLVRCAFLPGQSPSETKQWLPDPAGETAVRMTYAGRLQDLERWYSDDGGRKSVERPRTRRTVSYRPPRTEAGEARASVFGSVSEWFVFEDERGCRPDLLAFAHVSRRVRDALMAVGPQPPPGVISGHGPGGGPSERPHLAVLPLADVGWTHSSGDLLGFAVVLPRAVDPSEREAVVQALAEFTKDTDPQRSRAILRLSRQLEEWVLEYSRHPSRASLQPRRWCNSAHTWASATPIFLDRFPDHDDPVEEAHIIATACTNIGLPEPVQIEIHKHSAISGAPSAYPRRRGRSPAWSLPKGARFSERPRRHVVLRFEQRVQGPVVLGAGRYHGLGLCLPLREASRK